MRRRRNIASLYEVLNVQKDHGQKENGHKDQAPVRPSAEPPPVETPPAETPPMGGFWSRLRPGREQRATQGQLGLADSTRAKPDLIDAKDRAPTPQRRTSDAVPRPRDRDDSTAIVAPVRSSVRPAPRVVVPQRLPELPEVEASKVTSALSAPPARIWSWLNEGVEARRVTIGIFAVGALLASWIAYRTGESRGEEKWLIRQSTGDAGILGTIDPGPDGTRRAAVRGGTSGNRAPGIASPAADRSGAAKSESPAGAAARFGVQVALTPVVEGAQVLVQHLNSLTGELGATAGIVETGPAGNTRYRVIVGSCDSEEDAKLLLRRVKALKDFKGTDFDGAVISKY